MKPGPSGAKLHFLNRIRLDESPKSAQDWLVTISLDEKWFSTESEAREAAERWLSRFLTLLRNERNEFAAIGRFSRYEFNSSSDDFLQGCAFIEPRDSPSVRAAKESRARYDDYALALRSLT